MFDELKAAWDKAGQDWPDGIVTIRVGLTEHYADQVFLFAFDKGGCLKFLVHLDRTRFSDIIGKGA
jgi:hypothetical protein